MCAFGVGDRLLACEVWRSLGRLAGYPSRGIDSSLAWLPFMSAPKALLYALEPMRSQSNEKETLYFEDRLLSVLVVWNDRTEALSFSTKSDEAQSTARLRICCPSSLSSRDSRSDFIGLSKLVFFSF